MKLRIAKTLHTELNGLLFNGELSTPVIRLTRSRRVWAWFWVDCNDVSHIRLNKELNADSFGVNTLAHEMVHQWQYEILGNQPEHDLTFWMWGADFEKHGLTLDEVG